MYDSSRRQDRYYCPGFSEAALGGHRTGGGGLLCCEAVELGDSGQDPGGLMEDLANVFN